MELKVESVTPKYKEVGETVINLRKLGMKYPHICKELGIDRFMAMKAARWAKEERKKKLL